MKLIITLIYLYFISICTVFAQNVSFRDLPDAFEHPYQISSLDNQGDTLFMASEDCNLLFLVDVNSGEHLETIDLSEKFNRKLEIEGLSIIGDHMIFTDESSNRLLAYNWKSKTQVEIECDDKVDFNRSRGGGLEGIEASLELSKLWVVKEKNRNGDSELYTFEMKVEGGKFILDFISKLVLNQENGQRYSGIALDDNGSFLYLIRSVTGQYFVDRLPLQKETGIPQEKSKFAEDHELQNLSKEVTAKKGIYSTNIEGITQWKGSLLIVSDNLQGDTDCYKLRNGNFPRWLDTMLMEVKL